MHIPTTAFCYKIYSWQKALQANCRQCSFHSSQNSLNIFPEVRPVQCFARIEGKVWSWQRWRQSQKAGPKAPIGTAYIQFRIHDINSVHLFSNGQHCLMTNPLLEETFFLAWPLVRPNFSHFCCIPLFSGSWTRIPEARDSIMNLKFQRKVN